MHRNIRPENIWMSTQGSVKLSGFDHAIEGIPHSNEEANCRQMPKDHFGSPEAQEGMAGAKQDLWNVGVLYYDILFGILPFGHDLSEEKLDEYIRNRDTGHFKQWPKTDGIEKCSFDLIK